MASWLNSFHVYAFVLISGYLFYYSRYECGKYAEFKPFFVGKIKRLLVPYVVVSVVWVIPISAVFFDYRISDVIKKYVLATGPAQLWFLIMLFDVYIVFWFLSTFFERHDVLGAAVVFGSNIVGVLGAMVLPNVFMVWRACQYLTFFWLGFKLRQRGSVCVRKIPAWAWILLDVAIYVLVIWTGKFDYIAVKCLRIGLSYAMNIVGALMAFAVLQKIAENVNWHNKYFKFLSSKSMTVYLFHQQIIYFVILGFNGVINPYIHAGMNFVSAMVCSLAIATVLMKFKVTRMLMGEK